MQHANKRLSALAALAGIVLSMTSHMAYAVDSTWDDIKKSGIVRVGVITNRPCYYWQKPGETEWRGFPVQMSRDIVEAMSKEMGEPLKVEWVPTGWNTVILDAQASKLDIFVGLAETEERKRAVNMFGPLWSVPDVAIARPGITLGKTWESFNNPNVKVSVAMGTTTEQTARKYVPNAQIRALKSTNDAILDVQSQNSDIFINTAISGLAAMKENANLANLVMPEPLSSIPAGGITRKDGDGKLAAFIQHWSEQYRASGKVDTEIKAALVDCGLDVSKLPANTKF